MTFIPDICGSRYSNISILMRETMKDYVKIETGSVDWKLDYMRRE